MMSDFDDVARDLVQRAHEADPDLPHFDAAAGLNVVLNCVEKRRLPVAGQVSSDPVAEFCAELRGLVQGCGIDRAVLARRMGYSHSQLYAILSGRIGRPPEWHRFVEPLVRECTGNDERVVRIWRHRHEVLVGVYSQLKRRHRSSDPHTPGMTRVVPAQLPAAVEVFTGRLQELAELDYLLTRAATTTVATREASGESRAVVISAVSGTAGIGKTALALRWAYRVKDKFPDGQLYVDLRGFDPEQQPLSAADALAAFLRALGLAGQNIPMEVEERAATYRSLLDRQRVLIVLDNASSVEQVRPLLPGTPSCVVLVTSRDSVAGLVARYGARRVDLDLLPLDDAVALLAALIGERVQAEAEEAATLAKLCARLPLALRVAAELAAAHPTSSLAQLVGELADEQQRLELLDAGGDPRTAVRGVFSWSYQHLPVIVARTFRLIGLHPGPNFDSHAVAALASISHNQAQDTVDLLARAHLIQNPQPGRYSMHDLLRAYAAELAFEEDSDVDRQAALTRLFDYYLATAAAAMDILVPAERHRRPHISLQIMPSPVVADSATARAWLDAERATLLAVSAYTAARGWPGHATRLSTTLYCYLDAGGHFSESLTIHTHALHAARHAGEPVAEADTLLNLGYIYWQRTPESGKAQINLSGVQAIVADLYRCSTSRHLIFRFNEGQRGRAFIGALAPSITMADVQVDVAPEPLLNIGISYTGLSALGVDSALLAKFDSAFKRGPRAFSMALGDVPGSRSDPAHWWEGQFNTEDVHCIVHIYVRSDKAAQDATQMVRNLAHKCGVVELIPRSDGTILEGRSLGGAKLHFGYTDGISHPVICWNDAPAPPTQVNFRNLLLGYSTDEYPSAPARGPAADFARDSTYGMFRWIYQDVAAFNLFLSTEGPQLYPELPPADAEELLAAKMMGRWRDGTPLVLSPDRPDPQLAASNEFGYATQDPDGLRCPFSAHIRIVNPRDTPLDPIVVDGVPKILRRGMPYGLPLQGTTDDGADRGLLGIFLYADLRQQVYTLTSRINRNDFSPVYDNNRRVQDPLFGNRAMPGTTADFTVPAVGGDITIKRLPDFVHTKGTAFLLYPSKATLTALLR